jgi:hypothetical protein
VPTTQQTEEVPTQGGTNVVLPVTGSGTGVKLLYDRTYEMFSAPRGGKTGFANRFGVWADVAAWYYLLDMIPNYPETWDDGLIVNPPQYKQMYLFLGMKMVYFGWIQSLGVTYTHWTQEMVPTRCAVDISFSILPHYGDSPGRGTTGESSGDWASNQFGWSADWLADGQGAIGGDAD